MRALLINPDFRTITEINIAGDWDLIREQLDAYFITIAMPALFRHPGGAADAVYIDDHQMEAQDDPRGWFQIDASAPHAGRALVIGIDPGEPHPTELGVAFYEDLVGPDYCGGAHCDARIRIADLAARVTFTRRKFRKYHEATNGLIRIVAPIVEER